jgi:WD40 repeat protein/DNA-binding SARP family transcriptional activator
VLELRLLGQFDVRVDGAPVVLPSRNAQSLLAFLAVSAGTAHRRERLAALLWPETEENNACSYLRHALWRIRRGLEASLPDNTQYLLADDLTVAFNARSPYWLDAAQIERAASDGATTELLLERLEAYAGELLPGFDDEWVVRERERLEAVFDRQMDRLLERLVVDQRWVDVLESAERWIAVGHVPEPAFRALMIAHSERGDRARVATIYRRCREALFEELGAQPSDKTRALFERLSRGDRVVPSQSPSEVAPIGSIDDAPPAPGDAPFLGLQHFEEKDAALYFGRERLVRHLVERIRTERFLALIGASGSGKSSLVRAGVLPNLGQHGAEPAQERSGWVHVLTPTARPLEALAATVATGIGVQRLRDSLYGDPRCLRRHLRESGTDRHGALLVIDQFEELFTLCHDPFEREAFVDNLLSVSTDTHSTNTVLIALRADFYAHCAQFDGLRDMLAAHQEYLGPMIPEELARAIQGPAEAGGWTFEAGLVDLLLRDVGDEPGSLPLLSHALLETWLRRRARRLTLSGYAEAGGVHGAIARTAESTLRERLTVDQQAIARRVFLRLTELGEGTQDTRRRASVDELVTDAIDRSAVLEVLDILASARLVTLDRATAEVAHEALIREWPTLRAWLDEDRTGLRLHRALAGAARDWERQLRDPDLLYRGARLAQAREWVESRQADLNPSEIEFVKASVAHAEQQINERESQRQRELEAARQLATAEQERAGEQARAATRLRRRAVALGGALLLALCMTGAALFFGAQARQGITLAQANARIATARELAAAAVGSLDADPEWSILLARQAVLTTYNVDATSTIEAENALHRAVLTSRARLTMNAHTGAVSRIAFSPDGSRIASTGDDGLIEMSDATNGSEVWTVAGKARASGGIAFSPDGSLLAVSGDDNTVAVLDARSGIQHLTLTGHAGTVTVIRFSPDGTRLATAAPDGMMKLWDAASGQQLRTVFGSIVRDLDFSPDGTRVLTVEQDGTVSVWSATDASEILPSLTVHIDGQGVSASFSPDGRRFATIDGTDVRIWDPDTGRELQRLTASNTNLSRAAFSRDGARLAVGGLDRQVTVWDARTGGQLLTGALTDSGRPVVTLAGHLAPITDVAFAPDGARLASAAEDGTIKLWDLGLSHEVLAVPTPDWLGPFRAQSPPLSLDRVVYDPSGQHLAIGLQDNRAEVRDATTGQELLTLGSGNESEKAGLGLAFSPDGHLLATGGGDGVLKLWDASSGAELRSITAHPGLIFGVAFSPDGRRLASAGLDGAARVWDLTPAEKSPIVLRGHTAAVSRVAFSADGKRLATSSVDATARIWDAATGVPLMILGHSALPLTQRSGSGYPCRSSTISCYVGARDAARCRLDCGVQS